MQNSNRFFIKEKDLSLSDPENSEILFWRDLFDFYRYRNIAFLKTFYIFTVAISYSGIEFRKDMAVFNGKDLFLE